MLRMGNTIRLTGDEAKEYLGTTGRATLPKTVAEYNRAMDDAALTWKNTGCAEGELLAALVEDSKIA